ncbi:MAG: beta-L-arabinofuranosidase domain-containing protein [Bryobacteraceae bacterium]|jgi:DUF1680 family protein
MTSTQDSILPPTRRRFAALLAGAAAAAPLPVSAQQHATLAPEQRRRRPLPEVSPFDGPIEFSGIPVALKAEPFPMTQVRVSGGVYKDAADWNRGYMSRLAADRLLHNFRRNAGLPVGGAEPLGGWESPADGKHGTELRGHFTGHFLPASAQLYASTGDLEAKTKADYMVAEMAKVQQELGGGYLSAFPTELFDRLDKLSGRPFDPSAPFRPNAPRVPWAPFYTIHKIMAGMIDMYQFAGNRQALEVAQAMADWTDRWSAAKTEDHMQQILNIEFGGMAESLYNLSTLTGNEQWAKTGDRFTKKLFVNPLGLRRDELRGLHVNTHVPQAIAAARRYELSGDMRFHDVAEYFWYEVTSARSYVTTGTSNNEHWNAEPRHIAWELNNTRGSATAECCCSYNMLKLTRKLFSWTADPRYFDYYERSILNMRIGTIRPQSGHTQYYLSLVPGAYKTFNTEDQSFWCCTGTGVEEYSKLNDSIYWRDQDGIYVNLFIPSEVNWVEKGFRLKQEAKFPEQAGTALEVTAERPTELALRLRIPAWLRSAPVIKLNGKALEASSSPGSYLALTRTWKTGDRVEMEMRMHLTTEATPDDPHTQAFLYGPLVLAGDFGAEGLNEHLQEGPSAPALRRGSESTPTSSNQPDLQPPPPMDVPALHPTGDFASWVKPGDQPLTFRITGQSKDVTLAPLNSIFDKRYVVYWQVS